MGMLTLTDVLNYTGIWTHKHAMLVGMVGEGPGVLPVPSMSYGAACCCGQSSPNPPLHTPTSTPHTPLGVRARPSRSAVSRGFSRSPRRHSLA